MTEKTKELLFFISTLSLTIICSLQLFGIENLKAGNLVLNVHDTYFVISALHFFVFVTPLVFTISYLIRNLIIKFQNKISNIILLIFNGFLLFILLTSLIVNEQDGLNLWILILTLFGLELFVFIKTMKLKNKSNK